MISQRGSIHERGIVLIEMVIVGFAVVALAIPVLMTTLAYAEAQAEARLVASDAASWVARHGVLPETPDDLSVALESEGEIVVVSVRTSVRLIGVDFTIVEAEARTLGHARTSPYRSGR